MTIQEKIERLLIIKQDILRAWRGRYELGKDIEALTFAISLVIKEIKKED